MWTVLLSTTAIAAVIGMGMAPAKAASLSTLAAGNTNIQVAPAENVGYRRRFYRRYGYPVPYAYYPPAYGDHAPPSAYVYPPPPAGAYADAPPPEGDYADAPAPDGDYVDAPARDGDYADVHLRAPTTPIVRPRKVISRTARVRMSGECLLLAPSRHLRWSPSTSF